MGIMDNVPDEVLEQIFTNRDLNYRDLVSAGQTCQRWFPICDNILKKRKAAEIKQCWSTNFHLPFLPRVQCAAYLASRGYLTAVRHLQLVNLDLTQVAAEKLGHLCQCVTDRVYIDSILGRPMSNI